MGRGHVILLFLTLAAGVACRTVSSGPAVIQPGSPGSPSKTVSAQPKSGPAFTGADVQFMQGMIGHHAQALEMTALLRTRTNRDDMKLLALRIDVSQTDEIKMMQRWLSDRGQRVPMVMPGMDMAAMPGTSPTSTLMPGMLTPDQMAKLAAAKGPECDRLFLEFMIQHHEGAIVMVADLFSHDGAAQRGEIFGFASDVEADQSAEIARMRKMLGRE